MRSAHLWSIHLELNAPVQTARPRLDVIRRHVVVCLHDRMRSAPGRGEKDTWRPHRAQPLCRIGLTAGRRTHELVTRTDAKAQRSRVCAVLIPS
jgi:hypothetical protein